MSAEPIIRHSPDCLRAIADQCDAMTAFVAAGGLHPADHKHEDAYDVCYKGKRVAVLHWWDDQQMFLAEMCSPAFTPEGYDR